MYWCTNDQHHQFKFWPAVLTTKHQAAPKQGPTILSVGCTNSVAVSTRLEARSKLTTSSGGCTSHQSGAACWLLHQSGAARELCSTRVVLHQNGTAPKWCCTRVVLHQVSLVPPSSTRCHLPPELRRKCSALLFNVFMF